MKLLLYSGGLDSFIASHLFRPDRCLYVDLKSRYSDKEIANLVPPAYGELVFDHEILNLQHFERPDLIIPQRNAFLILAGALYGGSEIMLGATQGDRSKDKDLVFASRMNELLAHIWSPQHWLMAGRTINVTLPMRELSKRELVRRYLRTGGDPALLQLCVSCYDSDSIRCGRCKACARKWMALVLNGVECRFDADPSDYFSPETIRLARKGEYRGQPEDNELLEALRSWRIA